MYQPMNMNYGMMCDMAALQRSLKLIEEAVEDEKRDELFYDYLISKAPTREEKKIIASIRDDEIKHNKMFRKIYMDFTGKEIKIEDDVEFEKPKSYLDGIKKALFGELKAVEKYRIIRQGLPGRYYRDMLFEIITDELKHSSKYNYIYTINYDKKMPRTNFEFDKIDKKDVIEFIAPLLNRTIGDKFDDVDLERALSQLKLSDMLEDLKDKLDDYTKKMKKWEKDEMPKVLEKFKKRD
ncbi:ferritin-like domain-containing protein [Clostridium aestuarii]|uniref:Ferritin-like domain-containing protein n=1 Tax=Clostridium aestuarii TaxID=338193 RepID=A0ABT4D0R9_9CLOT|nr:ferritin-like domain-containing protein [Clostridium aestuarii]MCY6484833.1 ferritin-like domain-containing protein [Clostridium aestuarii]